MKSVSFYLQGAPRLPNGGCKMIFEYANSLIDYGYRVNILYDARKMLLRFHFPFIVRKFLVEYLCQKRPIWFGLHHDIKKYCIMDVDQDVPDADFIFATAISTAETVCHLSKAKGEKFYFIQGYENWNGFTDKQIKGTYQLGMNNVVISNWLRGIVAPFSKGPVFCIPNFVDTRIFDMDIKPEKREVYSLSMLCSDVECKGTRYGMEVLKRLKKIHPQLHVYLFGTGKRPADAEPWMEYIENATERQLRAIYNRSSIYIYPSLNDGWGLTGMESMACGCAYVASDYGGVHEYAVEDKTVLLSTPKDIDGMVRNVEYLIRNKSQRMDMAWQGYHDIRSNFSKNESIKKFLNLLE